LLPGALFRRRRGRIAVAGQEVLLLIVVLSTYSPAVVTWDYVYESEEEE
jgi:hypothetical protein